MKTLKFVSTCLLAATALTMPEIAAAQDAEEIIVTATRTERSIQDVPIAVTVNTGEQLAEKSVVNIENISAVSPSIAYRQTNNNFAAAGLLIRGIGTIGNNRAFEGSTGVFVDGVYRSRPGQVLQTFLDVDNAQVLRGPQGTLFGKNTTAGAFLIDGKKPEFNEFGGFYNASYGNYDAYRLQAGINLSSDDNLAFRFAGSIDSKDGEWTNLFDGSDHGGGDSASLRGSVLWEPTDDISLLLTGDWGNMERTCCYDTSDITNGAASAISTGILTASLGRAMAAPLVKTLSWLQNLSAPI